MSDSLFGYLDARGITNTGLVKVWGFSLRLINKLQVGANISVLISSHLLTVIANERMAIQAEAEAKQAARGPAKRKVKRVGKKQGKHKRSSTTT